MASTTLRSAVALACCAALACGRDLAVPAQQPPRIASLSIEPPAGLAELRAGSGPLGVYSSERLLVRGTGLGRSPPPRSPSAASQPT